MPRINIEDNLFRDRRFAKLMLKVGDEDKALGMIVRVWILAQENWLKYNSIPEKAWPKEYESLIEVELATRLDDGSVYVKGSKESFAWLTQKSKAGSSSSEKKIASIKNAREKKAEIAERALNGNRTEFNGSEALSLSLPLSQNKEKTPTQEKPSFAERESVKLDQSELDRCVRAWGETLRELGIEKDPRSDDHILARMLQKYPRPDQVYHIVRGQRWESGSASWDVRKHLSLQKVLNDPAKAEKLENLSRSIPLVGSSTESKDKKEVREYAQKLKDERLKLEGYDQLNNDGWK